MREVAVRYALSASLVVLAGSVGQLNARNARRECTLEQWKALCVWCVPGGSMLRSKGARAVCSAARVRGRAHHQSPPITQRVWSAHRGEQGMRRSELVIVTLALMESTREGRAIRYAQRAL